MCQAVLSSHWATVFCCCNGCTLMHESPRHTVKYEPQPNRCTTAQTNITRGGREQRATNKHTSKTNETKDIYRQSELNKETDTESSQKNPKKQRNDQQSNQTEARRQRKHHNKNRTKTHSPFSQLSIRLAYFNFSYLAISAEVLALGVTCAATATRAIERSEEVLVVGGDATARTR